MAEYISQLDQNTPTGASLGSVLDDELRGIKEALLNTFSALDAEVVITAAELNTLTGLTQGVQLVLDSLSTQATNLQNRTQVYYGHVGSDGTAINMPSGWSSSRVSTGHYRVTHNLAVAQPIFATPILSFPQMLQGKVSSIGTNTVDVDFYSFEQLLGDTEFHFLLADG